jgi:hypothetical protein
MNIQFNESNFKLYSVEEYKNLNEDFQSQSSPIIGVVEGKSFVLDGVSRNGRFYSAQLWKNALKDSDTLQMIEDKLMYGCIGHPEDYTLDDLLAQGKVSHIVTKIWINENNIGMARYEILDTEAGRILLTILKAGSKINVSTRAFGEFKNESKTIGGKNYKVINEKTFKIESIDFVITPGIADVDVSLLEKLESVNKKDILSIQEKSKTKNISCENGICNLIEDIKVYESLKEEFDLKFSTAKNAISTLKEENSLLYEKLKETPSTDDKKEEISQEEKDRKLDEDLTIIYSLIEALSRDISLLTEYKDVNAAMNNILDGSEITPKSIKTFIDIFENTAFPPAYLNDGILIVKKLKEVYKVLELKAEKKFTFEYDSTLDQKKQTIKNAREIGLNKEIEKNVKESVAKVEQEYKEILLEVYSRMENYDVLKRKHNKVLEKLKEKENLVESEKNKNNKLNKSILEHSKKYSNKDSIILEKNKIILEKESQIENLKNKVDLLEKDLHEIKFEKKSLDEKLSNTETIFFNKEFYKKVNEKVKEETLKIEEKFKDKLLFKEEKFESKIEKIKSDKNLLKEDLEKQKEIENKKLLEKQKEIDSLKSELLIVSQNEENKISEVKKSLKEEYSLNEDKILNLQNENLEKSKLVEKYRIKFLKSIYLNVSEAEIKNLVEANVDDSFIKSQLEQRDKLNNTNETLGHDFSVTKIERKTEPSLMEKLV